MMAVKPRLAFVLVIGLVGIVAASAILKLTAYARQAALFEKETDVPEMPLIGKLRPPGFIRRVVDKGGGKNTDPDWSIAAVRRAAEDYIWNGYSGDEMWIELRDDGNLEAVEQYISNVAEANHFDRQSLPLHNTAVTYFAPNRGYVLAVGTGPNSTGLLNRRDFEPAVPESASDLNKPSIYIYWFQTGGAQGDETPDIVQSPNTKGQQDRVQ
jgi:hypothetical protein